MRTHGTLYVWTLGVGIVVCGQFFGWNEGLAGNGPVAMLVASLIVCLLFLTWVLALAELSVAMPSADGPLRYGQKTGGNFLGFVMGWSMLLECQFGAIATAIASGSYVAFLLNPDNPDPAVRFWAGLATVIIFFFFQAWGFREQAWIQILMTCTALGALMIYWGAASTGFQWDRFWPANPGNLFGNQKKGWGSVRDAIPYALWWLIIIEGVALAAEELKAPQRSIPRGLILGMFTIIAMMLLTLVLGCAAMDWNVLADPKHAKYPLAKVVSGILRGGAPILLHCFGVIALFGLVASYHGLLFSVSRQTFSLGRAGFLPRFFGKEHAPHGTPVPALLVSSLITIVFLLISVTFSEDAVAVAVLVAGLSSLIWYVLAMVCLYVLRRREPETFRNYHAPVRKILPAFVLVLSLFTIGFFGKLNVNVLPLTVGLYAFGLAIYYFWSRSHVQASTQPISLASTREREGSREVHSTPGTVTGRGHALERLTAGVLVLFLVAMFWITLRAAGVKSLKLGGPTTEILLILGLVTLALVLVSTVALMNTQRSHAEEDTAS